MKLQLKKREGTSDKKGTTNNFTEKEQKRIDERDCTKDPKGEKIKGAILTERIQEDLLKNTKEMLASRPLW